MQISDLSPATAYLFKVQALSSDGSSSSDVTEYEFTTMPEGKGRKRRRWRRRRRELDISDVCLGPCMRDCADCMCVVLTLCVCVHTNENDFILQS